MEKKYKVIKTNKLKGSEVEIEAEISFDEVKKHRAKALAKIQQGINLDGFRPGKAPESVIVSKIGDLAIWEEAAEFALQPAIIDIVEEGKYEYMGQPQVVITKIAVESPVEFKIRLVIMPDIKLPDYKAIAKKINVGKVTTFETTDKELEEAIEKIRKTYAQHYHTHPEGEEHKEGEELKLPEVNEEFIKKLGEFKDMEDFKTKVKESLVEEKKHKEGEKNRLTIAEKIISETEIELPQILVAVELNKMEAQFRDDIARYGLKTEDYLKHLNKKMEDLHKEWTVDAEKRAKLQLVINKISLTEKIEPNKEDLEKEIKYLLETYKEAQETRVREYVTMMMTNEAVFKMLEEVK